MHGPAEPKQGTRTGQRWSGSGRHGTAWDGLGKARDGMGRAWDGLAKARYGMGQHGTA